MFRVWIKDHKLPIGAKTQDAVDEIKSVYGEDVVLVEESSNYKYKTYNEYLELIKH